MFTARRRREATVQAATVHAQLVPVADPDTAAIQRERALRYATGRMMQGHAGDVIDYDRGDPEHSFTRVLRGYNNPTAALARLGMADTAILQPQQIYDAGVTDPTLTAYQAAMLARIATQR